ncbi:type II toxin-antitoxin system prevent-host-death family antitoxin [Brevundimonas sp. FT23042]|uniref:type II toxin-antitoxin system prevent-host-death family antitoxin n=1 Tax=Brevundimonas sp. FT23042 TaxID=3393749 RepID=UPI003B5882AD
MRTVGVLEAKTNLSALLDAVEAGEVVVITRHGKAVARLEREQDYSLPKRRLSGHELAERARKFRESQKPDPEFDGLSWEELKKIARE